MIGVFGYSDEDGTEAARLPGQLSAPEIEARRPDVADLADELIAQRAEARVGSAVEVLVEETTAMRWWAAPDHQGPGGRRDDHDSVGWACRSGSGEIVTGAGHRLRRCRPDGRARGDGR